MALGALVALSVLLTVAGGSSNRAARLARQDLDRAAPAAVLVPMLKHYTIGRSVQGRRIDAFKRGAPGAAAPQRLIVRTSWSRRIGAYGTSISSVWLSPL